MAKEIWNVCKNVYSLTETKNGSRKFKLEDIDSFTLVFERSSFEIQHKCKYIYFIPKYDTVLTYDQAVTFMNNHAHENFIVMDDYDGRMTKIFFFITSKVNLLTVDCFHALDETQSHLIRFAQFKTQYQKAAWGEKTILSKTVSKVMDKDPNQYRRYDNDADFNLYFMFPEYSCSVNEGEIINGKNAGDNYKVADLLKDFLLIEGKTRIVRDPHYRNYFRFATGIRPEKEDSPIWERYGQPLRAILGQDPHNNYSMWDYKYGGSYMLSADDRFESTLSKEEYDRIAERINLKLDNKEDPNSKYKMITTDILVISDPIPGHRRPSFHFIRGFRCNGITEIVELSRGEMLMKDMMPEKIYCLTDLNTYCLASYNLKTAMIEIIKGKEVEIDPVSFNKWAEDKSLHPYLLKLLTSNFFEDISLDMIKTLNRLPFGSLLIEQLITTHHTDLAMHLAQYINDKAYDFNYDCGKLDDIFPGANGEETSLYKILNISRNTAKYLFESEDDLNTFIVKYRAVHYYGGNLILTDDIKNKIEIYIKLREIGLHKFKLLWGDRMFDFIAYPELAKQIVRMSNKIKALTNLETWKQRDIENKYNEIVRAYASFLDYSTLVPENEKELWIPEGRLKIFLEFSLVGTPDHPLDPVEEISSREKAANTALKIYEAKANEKMRADNEKKFATRHSRLNRLKSLQSLEKENPDFSGYIVIPPTKIYGVTEEGSVEKEANDLSHCLFRCYAQRIIEGEYTTMWLRKKNAPNRSIITIGITSDGRIEQTRGMNDRDATVEEAKAIAAWAESKKGLVTFKSEGSDVRPGGWPWGVPVPSLPKPEKTWLSQLRNSTAVEE